jgi:very-short-patch-repair endonuclease
VVHRVEKDTPPSTALRAGPFGETDRRVEDLTSGDWVLDYRARAVRVSRIQVRRYIGPMILISVGASFDPLRVTPAQLVLLARRIRKIGAWNGLPPEQFARARILRRSASPPERKLWELLRNNGAGVKFRRQHPIGPYIADFYSRDAALVVEVDGESHFVTPDAESADQKRDFYSEQLGLRVLRFTAHEVGTDPEAVLLSISRACRETILLHSPEFQWISAANLRIGDLVHRTPTNFHTIQKLQRAASDETVYWFELEGSTSVLTRTCALRF